MKLFLDPARLSVIIVGLVFGGGLFGTFATVLAALCWAVAALLALVSVVMLLKGVYRKSGDRSTVVVCAGLGALVIVFLCIHFVANPTSGELAIYRDRALIVERPTRVVGLEPPASINLVEEVEIRLPVTVVDRKLVALSLSDEDRAELFSGLTDVEGRNRKAKEILSRALGREIARSAQGATIEEGLRRYGLVPYRARLRGVAG